MDGSMFMSRHDLSFHFIFCDARAVNLIGYEPSDLLGRTAYQFHCPRDVLICLQCHKQLIIGGSSVSGYYRFLARTGAWVWLYTCATMVYDTAHNPQYIVCRNYVVSQDEAERALFREKRGFERMKCLGFSLDTELPVAEAHNPSFSPTVSHLTKHKCPDTSMLVENILSPPAQDVSDNNYVRSKKRWRDLLAGIDAGSEMDVSSPGQFTPFSSDQIATGIDDLHPLESSMLSEPLGKSMSSSGDSQFDVITASITSMFGIPADISPINPDNNHTDIDTYTSDMGPVISHPAPISLQPYSTLGHFPSSGGGAAVQSSLSYVQQSSGKSSSSGLRNADSSSAAIFSTLAGAGSPGHDSFSSSNCGQEVFLSSALQNSAPVSDSMDCLMEPLSSGVNTNGGQPIGHKQTTMYNCLDNILSMMDNGQQLPDRSSTSDLHDALTSGNSDPFLTDISQDLPYIDLIDAAALDSPKVGKLDSYLPPIPGKAPSDAQTFSGSDMNQTSPESSSDSDSSGKQSLLRSLLDKEASVIEGPLTYKEWILKQSFLKHKDVKKCRQPVQNTGRSGGSKRQRTVRSGMRKSVELPLPPSAAAACSKVRRRSTEVRRPTKELPLPPTAVSHSPGCYPSSGKASCFSENLLLKAMSSPASSTSTTKNELEELGLPDDLLDLAVEYGSALGSDQAEALISELNEAANWEDGFGSFIDSAITSKAQTSTNGVTCQFSQQSLLSSKQSLPSLPHKAPSSNLHNRTDLTFISMSPRSSDGQTKQCLMKLQQPLMGLIEQRKSVSTLAASKPTMSLLRAAVTSPDMNSLIEQIPFGKPHQSKDCGSQKSASSQVFKIPSTGKPSPSRSPGSPSGQVTKSSYGQVSRAVSTCVQSGKASPCSPPKVVHSPSTPRSVTSPTSPRSSGSLSDSSNTEPVSVMIMRKESHRARRSRTIAVQTDNKPDEVYPELEYSPSDTILFPSSKPSTPPSPRTSRVSELERFLRGSPSVEPSQEERAACSAPFLQMLLTGQLSRDNYQRLDQQLLEREKRDSTANH